MLVHIGFDMLRPVLLVLATFASDEFDDVEAFTAFTVQESS